jgi:nicotinate-nucleotide adenylyltransferase
MRIGVMGGTFDPIHLGHLRAAEEIYWAFGLDHIIFVPAAHPPHKYDHDVAAPIHRYEMVSLATVFTPYFSVSPIELNRPGTSYSVETVRELLKLHGPETHLCFIMGVDAFLEMSTWRDAQEILHLTQVVVTARPGWRLDEVEKTLTPEQREKLGHLQFKYLKISEVTPELSHQEPVSGLVLLVEVVSLDISSREIRHLVEEGRSIRFLVPDTVAAYMGKNKLYQRRGEASTEGVQGSLLGGWQE